MNDACDCENTNIFRNAWKVEKKDFLYEKFKLEIMIDANFFSP